MAHAPQLPPMPASVREWLEAQYPYPRPTYTDTREAQLPQEPVTRPDPNVATAAPDECTQQFGPNQSIKPGSPNQDRAARPVRPNCLTGCCHFGRCWYQDCPNYDANAPRPDGAEALNPAPQPAHANTSEAHRPGNPYQPPDWQDVFPKRDFGQPPSQQDNIPLHMKDTMARALGVDYETGAPLPPLNDANHTETCGIADCGYQAMGRTPAEAVANLTRHLDDIHSEGDPPWLRASDLAAAATQYAADVAIAWEQNETIPTPARQQAVALAQQAASYAHMAAETMNRATSFVRAAQPEQ